MLRKIIRKNLIRKFNFLQNRDIKKIVKEEEKLKTLDPLIEKSYNPKIFKIFNSNKFLEKLKQMEKEDINNNKKFDYIQFFKNMQIPIFLILLYGIFHYMFQTIPFTVLFKDFTISEYTLQKYSIHNIFLSSLSVQKKNEFLLYGPVFLLSMGVLGRHLFTYQIFFLFIGNCFGSFFSTVFYEKYLKFKIYDGLFMKNESKNLKDNVIKNLSDKKLEKINKNVDDKKIKEKKQNNLLMPKFHGSTTSLFFFSFVGFLRSDYKIFNKILPIWTLPFFFIFYEMSYLRKNQVLLDDSNISHFANCVSICSGAVSAVYFKKYVKLQFL